MPATDTVTDSPLITLPPEAGDVNAPRFEPNEDWVYCYVDDVFINP